MNDREPELTFEGIGTDNRAALEGVKDTAAAMARDGYYTTRMREIPTLTAANDNESRTFMAERLKQLP